MKLALFFTRNVSLEMWVDLGLFDREKRLYEEHLRLGHIKKVYWLTYGKNDVALSEKLKIEKRLHPDIEILSMPYCFSGKWGRLLYSFLMPFIHQKVLKSITILKTNQMDGSWSAIITKFLFQKSLLLRTGYIITELESKINKGNKIRNKAFEMIERMAYRSADLSVVSSVHNKNYLIKKYKINKRLIHVIYNYIDTNLFLPMTQKKYENRIVFVGRLTKEKNLFNLIEAISKTGLILDIYGKGALQGKLAYFAKKIGAEVNFKGTVPNDKLPAILNQYHYYILPSLFEGMPKTLIEAMSCGCMCIGTDVPGINEVIEDGKTGFLAKGVDSESILFAIQRATNVDNKYILSQAVSKVQEKFSLAKICQKEYQIFSLL